MNADTAVSPNATKEKLVADLKVLIADTDELLRATASQAGEKAAAARDRIQASLSSAKVRLAEAERVGIEKTKQAAKATDNYVHEHPWTAIGITAAAALVIGMLIGRR